MTVPSYDDLTPGIPDVLDADTAQRLTSVLRELPAAGGRLPASGGRLPAAGGRLPAAGFFACLRLADVDAGSRPLETLLAIARDFSPRVRQVGARDVLLDVSGLGRLIGEPAEIARQLTRALDGAGVRGGVALAPTQTVARLLAHAATAHGPTLRHTDHNAHDDQPQGLCGRRDLRGLCAGACGRGPWLQLPVELLRELEVLPPAINHRDRDRPYEIFETWGIATLGDLAALPAGELSSRLGRRGVALHRLARGLDPAPFVPDAETPRWIGRLELEWPIDALEPLSFVFARLLDPLTAALERADRGAAAIRLELRLTDRTTETRLLQLPAAMRDPRVLRTLLLLDLESHPLFAAASEVMVDVVTIELDPAPARVTQFSLLQRALPSPETLSTLTARLAALVGDARVGSPVLLDSHRPDAFAMAGFTPDTPDLEPGRAGASRRPPVLRRQRGSIALHVSVEHGRPVHIASSRRGIPYGAITQAAGPWRTSGGWWLPGAEVSPKPRSGAGDAVSPTPRRHAADGVSPKPRSGEGGWNRNEWDVALTGGAVCRIYQDRATDRWFLEGVYD
ncbi:MAG TPA: hypothetical protein VFK57_01020 [Vicinamibacterales bacterium]|nr:hypothetical protein [Vicinamibacterales bacterium]